MIRPDKVLVVLIARCMTPTTSQFLHNGQTQLSNEFDKLRLRQGFSENIGHIVRRQYVLHFDPLVLNGLTNEMISQVYVFGAQVEFVVLG